MGCVAGNWRVGKVTLSYQLRPKDNIRAKLHEYTLCVRAAIVNSRMGAWLHSHHRMTFIANNHGSIVHLLAP